MIYNNIKMALNSLKSTKTRSFLAMLGVIIGISSVVIIVALGQGVKKQVLDQINQLGSDIVTVRPGKSFGTKANGLMNGVNSGFSVGTSTLTTKDVESLRQLPSVKNVTYNAVIAGLASSYTSAGYDKAVIIATQAATYNMIGQNLEFGEFYSDSETYNKVAVVGSNVANELFNQRDPIGGTITIRGEDFTIRGILAASPENPLNLGTNYNDVIYIPVEAGKKLTNNGLQISEFNIKVKDSQAVDQTTEQIRKTLFKNHGGQEDFTLIKQSEYIDVANQAFDLLTALVAAIAGISLLVGGIGIMNIMLVSVSERTREIGVRKAIGATNQQVLGQFLIEAIVISVSGGIIGIAISCTLAFVIRITTTIHPVLSVPIILLATGISTIVGIIFGMTPAIKAARQDPIEALRHE